MFESMKQETKITLSDKELELVCNSDWILTKQIIIDKVYYLFGKQAELMQHYIVKEKKYLPEEVNANSPKISKGENYGRLPYVMLDYPRCFEKEKTLAIRTMFWWGNFFSLHLQLSGKCKEAALKTLQKNFLKLQRNECWICISNNPWQHHFDAANYLHLKDCTEDMFASILNRESFVKIGKKIALEQWKEASAFIEQSFIELISLLKN